MINFNKSKMIMSRI